mmetsp:Transcript_32430/g.28716  ORF Transcript_32430/g.28716 Transcript_32430/m.28716 type:complete len:165 (-) Transcript_32430:29-523(-)
MEKKKHEKLEREMQECTFRPRINQPKIPIRNRDLSQKGDRSQNRSYNANSYARTNNKKDKYSSREVVQEQPTKILKHCQRKQQKVEYGHGNLFDNIKEIPSLNNGKNDNISFVNLQDGRYKKNFEKKDRTVNMDISPGIFGPPDIEALKQRVRDEIKALDTCNL